MAEFVKQNEKRAVMQRKGSRNLPLGNPLILFLNCKVRLLETRERGAVSWNIPSAHTGLGNP